ncbi:unnamed protein product [Rhizophagus irregularis]|nr:unnamed protein product [Rhizophagus irregularis]
MSPDQIYYYTKFHEVLIFDCTAGTNRYDMVLCLFIIVDNNTRSRLVASALLEDETESSFIWVLHQLKKVLNDFYPQVIYTDCDPAMANAISSVYPMTKHNLCIFHIDLNLKKNLRPKLGTQNFNEFRTQQTESLNRLLKDTVQKNFLLCQLESEIQNILDNEIKYERITKMHNSLPRQTLDDIPSKFFGHINEICKDFLTPHILTATQNQMK